MMVIKEWFWFALEFSFRCSFLMNALYFFGPKSEVLELEMCCFDLCLAKPRVCFFLAELQEWGQVSVTILYLFPFLSTEIENM